MRRHVLGFVSLFAGLIASCASSGPSVFVAKSDYPTDPWVKGYANPGDCLGGEALAAKNIPLPDYPKRAYNSGRQGWAIVRLDIDASGQPQNVDLERAVPAGLFSNVSIDAVKGWTFYPPQSGAMQACRILFRYRLGEVTVGG